MNTLLYCKTCCERNVASEYYVADISPWLQALNKATTSPIRPVRVRMLSQVHVRVLRIHKTNWTLIKIECIESARFAKFTGTLKNIAPDTKTSNE